MKTYYRLPTSGPVAQEVNRQIDSIESFADGRLNTLREVSLQMGLAGQIWRHARLFENLEKDERDDRYKDQCATAAQIVVPALVTVIFMAGLSNGDRTYSLDIRVGEPEFGDGLNAEEFLHHTMPEAIRVGERIAEYFTPHLDGVKILASGAVSLLHPYTKAMGKTPAQLHLQAMHKLHDGMLPLLKTSDLPSGNQ